MIISVFCFLLSSISCAAALEEYSKEWVVEVNGGLDEAKLVADQGGFYLLGEVLPQSNLYHFKQKSLNKRSTDQTVKELSEIKNVKSFSHQTVQKRVKRDFLEPEQISVNERELSVKEQCFVSTLETSSSPSRRCVFPFQYKGVLYQRCTSDHSTNGAQWCATSVARDGSVITGEWGDCDFDNVECRLLPPGEGEGNVPQEAPEQSSALQQPELTDFEPPRLKPKAKPLPPIPPPPPPPPPRRPPQGRPPPLGTRKLPGTLDEFLLLLGPRRPPPRPIVQDAAEEEENVPRDTMERFNDKEWPRQWYLNRGGELDMNVQEAWNMGYSGKGITVTILDDGVEWNHPDLSENYKADASIDINANDKDPFPRYDLFDTNKHGTRCAGQVSAQANNSFCSVGIAFNAGIGGVRMLDGTITDAVEARSLSLNPQSVDIYSASWGPDDDGQTVDGPGPLTRRAMEEGVIKGRDGLGSIYVWASGNGGKFVDNCNCDGYATSIFTVSISSASENGNIPWYSEQCSSTLATTYSSGSSRQGERKVITTDLHGRCTSSHTGTSASSPMAAGIIALVLEANPALNWRDVQHIIVRTSKKANLKADDWIVNAAGYNLSHAFGFGLMDAGAMVKLALDWKSVPEQMQCESDVRLREEVALAGRDNTQLLVNLTDCVGKVSHVEHVHLTVQISSKTRRGLFSIELESPAGTVSKLLAPRPLDNSLSGFSNFMFWPMMSTHYWGENPSGTWKLTVVNGGDRTAYIGGWRLRVYGTKTAHNTSS